MIYILVIILHKFNVATDILTHFFVQNVNVPVRILNLEKAFVSFVWIWPHVSYFWRWLVFWFFAFVFQDVVCLFILIAQISLIIAHFIWSRYSVKRWVLKVYIVWLKLWDRFLLIHADRLFENSYIPINFISRRLLSGTILSALFYFNI